MINISIIIEFILVDWEKKKGKELLLGYFRFVEQVNSFIIFFCVVFPQMLNVRIGNHVDIGANTCIDRGRLVIYLLWMFSTSN